MKTSYEILRPDGTSEKREVEWPFDPGYQLIKALVSPLVGGGVEHVSVLHREKRADMFVNEDGAETLAFNQAATDIYHEASRRRRGL